MVVNSGFDDNVPVQDCIWLILWLGIFWSVYTTIYDAEGCMNNVVISVVGAMIWKAKDCMACNVEVNIFSTEVSGVDGILNSFIDTEFCSTRDSYNMFKFNLPLSVSIPPVFPKQATLGMIEITCK